jgi:hypothetical protein
MMIVTKLLLRGIFAGAFNLCAVRIAMAMTIASGPLNFQSWETSSLVAISGNFRGPDTATWGSASGNHAHSASIKNSETILVDVEVWNADPLFWMSSMTVLPELLDQRLSSVDQLYKVLLLKEGDQNYGLDSIGDKMGGCDFNPEACYSSSLASSNGAESATGISEPTAILLIIIGLIGLMRARGRPIP